MNLTKKQWKQHKKVIQWFYEQPEGTKVWCREGNNDDWYLVNLPNWYTDYVYVINDKYAEIRKAIADGKEIEFFDGTKWCEIVFDDPNRSFPYQPDYYRVKEKKFPIFKKNKFMVAKFISENIFEILFIFNRKKFKEFTDYCFDGDNLLGVGAKVTLNIGNVYLKSEDWEEIAYDKDKDLWDGQPVWAWDNITKVGRYLKFYNAKYKTAFDYDGKKGSYDYDNYEPYPHLEDEWIVEAYNKLEFG